MDKQSKPPRKPISKAERRLFAALVIFLLLLPILIFVILVPLTSH